MARAGLLSRLLLVGLAVVAHAPALAGGWVYDDHRFVVENEALERIDPAAYLTDAATASSDEGIEHDIYRPLRTLDFAVDRAVYGERPWLWHLESLLWHVLVCLLMLRLVEGLLPGAPLAALLATALVAVHPVAVEVVAWISSRGDLMAVAGMLGALLVLERPGVTRTIVGAVLMALALLAKESALVLPALLLLRDVGLPAAARPGWRTTLGRTALLGLVAGGYLLWRGHVLGDLAQLEGFAGGSRLAAARTMLAGVAWYAGALLWPDGFPFDVHLLPPLTWGAPMVVVGAGLLLSVLLGGVLAWRRRSPLAFALLGALACLVPVSNVIVPLRGVVAERFLYPMLVCIAVGLAVGLRALARRLPRSVGPLATILLVVVLAPVTWDRARGWSDDLTLWTRVLEARPDHLRAYEGIAFEYQERGRVREAELAWRAYLDFNPNDGKAHRLLGDLLGETARSLRLEEVPAGTTTNVAARRRQARILQLRQYQQALLIWRTVGLERGRGSPAMLHDTWARVFEAAKDLGDLEKAREANDMLLRLEGVDPEADETVWREASLARRLARLELAMRAGLAPLEELPADQRPRALRTRAEVLEDLGIDAALGRRAVLVRLLERAEAIAAGSEGSVEARLPEAFLALELGDLDRAESILRALDRMAPGHPLVRRGLEDLLARRRSR